MKNPPRRSLFWIASYPKSGNTWLRIFLANYLFGGKEPLPINSVGKLGYADGDAQHYDRANEAPYDRSDPRQTVALRDKFLRNISATGPKVALIKTHNYNNKIDDTALIPAPLTRGALYVVRHPGDVAVSFASHYGLSIDDAIERIREPQAVVGGSKTTALQFTSDWSTHVNSWAGAKKHNVHVVRYEDMYSTPQETFGTALKHLGVAVDAQKIEYAIKHASFDELRKQENTDGFSENTTHQPHFFRKGKAGGWRDTLSESQISNLRKTHGKAMRTFGYV